MVDEATVSSQLIDERTEAIKEIHKDITEINAMYIDLANLVETQQVSIDSIFKNAEESRSRAEDGLVHIQRAATIQQGGTCCIS